MASFQINKYHQSLFARDANELKRFAQDGTLEPSDLIQPEGSKDWLYAGELPKIGEIVINNSYTKPPVKSNRVLGIILILISFGLFYGAYHANSELLSEEDLKLIGNALQEDQAMLTEDGKLYKDHKAKSTLSSLKKNAIVTLKDKRGDFFQVDSNGTIGWVSMHDVAPAYLFASKDIRYNYDARFNVQRKIKLSSYSWERPVYGSDETLFFLQLQNTSPYTVENIVFKLEFLDASGNIVQEELWNIEGKILAGDSSKIGTLNPAKGSDEELRILTISKLEELEKQDPKILNQWVDSIAMKVGKGSFSKANPTIVEAHAIVKD